jgi:hypothetical protein
METALIIAALWICISAVSAVVIGKVLRFGMTGSVSSESYSHQPSRSVNELRSSSQMKWQARRHLEASARTTLRPGRVRFGVSRCARSPSCLIYSRA